MATKQAARGCNLAVETDTGSASLPVAGQGKLSRVRKSTHARWRAAVLIGVQLLIVAHVTHFFVSGRTLSPVEPSESMYTLELGYVNAGFVFFIVALLSTLVLGRFFCGWGCHIVALQDLCAWMMKKLGIRPRPFRSRLLAFAPLVVALFMFVWPTARRLLAAWVNRLDFGPLGAVRDWLFGGAPTTFPGWTDHLVTTGFWDTFPGPMFAVLTMLTCGFAAVYLLGAKGFCTYGCPYGAFFGGLDRLSPYRIRVTDDCEQCGHCTATCTSNVRVHEEVRLYGMVVDPRCMKCTDCVSVCPKNALYLGFGKPALFRSRRHDHRRARVFSLGFSEELSVGAIALVATLAFRGLYDGPPLLMSVGLGGLTAFAALKLWHLWRKPSVRLQNLVLKLDGALRPGGRVFALLAASWLLFSAHSAFVQWHRGWGVYHLQQTQASREDVLSGAFLERDYPPQHYRSAGRLAGHFALADRWGFVDIVENKLGVAWGHLLAGEPGKSEGYIRAAVALAPDVEQLHDNLIDFLEGTVRREDRVEALEAKIEALGPAFEDLLRLGTLLAEMERYDDAVGRLYAAVEQEPSRPAVRFNLGGVLRRMHRIPEAIEQLDASRGLMPGDASVHIELGLAYAEASRFEEAIDTLRRAVELAPDSPESLHHLPGLIEQLENDAQP